MRRQQERRGFASAAAVPATATSEAIQQSENQVKDAIKKMMLDRQNGLVEEVLHPIEDEELDQSFQQFQVSFFDD